MARTPTRTPKPLTPGVYGPLPTFFDDKQDIDYTSYKKHLLHLARKGIGSLGEAVHLSYEERTQLIHFIRTTLDEDGLQATPIVAGVGGSSTRETIRLAHDAAEAGADAGLVILPAYYAASLEMDVEQVIQYYVDICEASPIPLFLYNFPANAAGQDMSANTIETIVRRTTNLCGVKLTCGGSVGKLVCLEAAIRSDPAINATRPFPFLLLDGVIADWTPWMQAGGHGTVSGIPNFAPAATMRLWALLNKPSLSAEETAERQRIQLVLGRADAYAMPAGIRGMKYVLHRLRGYGAAPRKPLLPLGDKQGQDLVEAFQAMLRLEEEIESAGKAG